MTLPATIPPPAPASSAWGWYLNGQAQTAGADLQLTAAGAGQGAGSAFYAAPLVSNGLQVAFTTSMSGGSGGGGITLTLADPTKTAPNALGSRTGYGFTGIAGTALVLCTDFNTPPGSGNYAGIATSTAGASGPPSSYLASTTSVPALRPGTHDWTVTVSGGVMTVTCDGVQILSQAVTLTPTVMVGFTAANGARDDTHIVRNVKVSASTVPLPAHQFSIQNYGAVGDGQIVTDGAMTTGAFGTTLACTTSLPFKITDIGKAILVKGAGPSGVTCLVTTIAAYTDAGHVILTAAASTTVTGALVCWATDDTAAIQATINAATVYAQTTGGYAEVYVPPAPGAFYGIAGPLRSGGATLGNSQLTLPVIPATANKVTLVIRGAITAATGAHWLQPVFQTDGCTLLSFGVFANQTAQGNSLTAAGNPSLLGGPAQPGGYGTSALGFNNMHIVLQGVELVTTYSSSGFNYCGADFSGMAQATVTDVNIGVTGSYQAGDFGTPTSFAGGFSKGLLMPAAGNNDICAISRLSVWGGYTWALLATEHTVIAGGARLLYCWSAFCPVGTYFNSAGALHAIIADQLSIEGVTNNVFIFGSGQSNIGPFIDVAELDTESAAPTFSDDGNSGMLWALGRIKLTGQFTAGSISLPATRMEIISAQQAPGPVTAPTLTLGTPLRNNFFRWATVTIAGGTLTAVKIGQTMGGASAPSMTTLYSQASGSLPLMTVRVPPAGWIEVDGTVAPTTWSWEVD